MSPKRLTTKFTAGALGLAVLGAAMLASPAPARAEEDNVPVDTKILRGILEGIGLRRDGEAVLSYPERAPLVIPPGKSLPPPEKSGDIAAKNPAWPVDPDVKRAKDEAAREKKRTFSSADEEQRHNENPLRPDEITPGPKQRAARRTDDGYQASPNGYGSQLPPAELGTKKSIFSSMFGKSDDAEVGKFTGEPPRASLTAPPPGYQTPSPDQPYGVGKEKPVQGSTKYDQAVGSSY